MAFNSLEWDVAKNFNHRPVLRSNTAEGGWDGQNGLSTGADGGGQRTDTPYLNRSGLTPAATA